MQDVGLFRFLRDNTASLAKKVKTARYLWMTETAYTPNKYQTLIDWVCVSITNKKKLKISEEDESQLWLCLNDMLESKKLIHQEKKGRPVFIKTLITQNIIEALVSKGKTCCLALSVACSILKLPSLSHIFTSRYETLVHLIESVILLCLSTRNIHHNYVNIILTRFASVQRQNNNQKMVTTSFVDKLLLPAIQLVEHKKCDDSWQEVVANLNCIIAAGLFQSEHGPMYESYLNMATSNGDKSTMLKVPHHVFLSVTKGLTTVKNDNEPQLSHDVASYLPRLYQEFQKAYPQRIRSEESVLHFNFLANLVSMLGINSQSHSLTVPTPLTLRVLHMLLQSTHEGEVYDVGLDNSSGAVQLKWFRMLVEKLLVLDCSDVPAWYNCLTALLHLNHEILKPKMSDIWTNAWIMPAKLSEEALEAQSQLFGSWLQVYIALRQVPSILAVALHLLKDSEKMDIMWPGQFLDVFREAIPYLPTAQVMNMWGDFILDIQNRYLEPNKTNCDKNIWLVSVLFHSFLINVKVAGSASMPAESVLDHTSRLRDEILLPMAARVTARKEIGQDFIRSFLLLTTAFLDLQILLKMYGKSNTGETLADSGEFKEAIFAVESQADSSVKYYKLLCLMSEIRNLNWSSNLIPGAMADSVRIVLADCLNGDVSQKDLAATWDGKAHSVNNGNALVACWMCMSKQLSNLMSFSEETSLSAAMMAGIVGNASSPLEETVGVSIGSMCCEHLQSRMFHECHMSQTAFLVHFDQSIRRIFSFKIGNRKQGRGQFFDVLSSLLPKVSSEEPFGEELKCELKDELMDCYAGAVSSPVCLTDSVMDDLRQILKALSWQPVESFSNQRKRDYSLRILAVLFSVRRHDKTIALDVATLCLQLLFAIVAGGSFIPVVCISEIVFKELYQLAKLCDTNSTEGERFLVAYKELLCVLAKNHLKEAQSTKSYLITFTKQGLEDALSKLGDKDNVQTLETLSIILSAANKMLKKDHIPDCVKIGYHDLFLKLEPLASELCGSSTGTLPHQLWTICSTLVAYHYRRDDQSEFIKHLMTLIQLALSQIHIRMDPRHVESCIGFIATVIKCSKHSSVTASYGIDASSVLQASIVTLTSLLRQVHKKISTKAIAKTFTGTKLRKVNLSQQEASMEVRGNDSKDALREDGDTLDRSHNKMETDDLSHPVSCKEEDDARNWNGVEGTAEDLIVLMLNQCPVDQFSRILHDGINDMAPEFISTEMSNISTGIKVWQKLLSVDVNEDKIASLGYASQHIMVCFQTLLQEVKTLNRTDDYIIANVVEPLLNVQTAILSHPQLKIHPNIVLVCNSCDLAPLHEKLSHTSFMHMFKAMYEVMNAVLLQHTHVALSSIPAFLSVTKNLLMALILRSDQGGKNKDKEEDLIRCAAQIERLFSLIATHKEEFSKVALHVVAEYVTSLQRVTLIPGVKKSLLPAVHLMLGLCDEHTTALLQTVLAPGVKHVFTSLYLEHQKHYKYTGRI